MARSPLSLSLSLGNATILSKIKEGYLVWMATSPHMPKGARYTMGARIENKFLDLLELAYTAYFIRKEEKSQKIAECIFVLDILKFLLTIAWEGKFLSHKQYEDLAVKLSEIGKMFWGWKKSIEASPKKNPA